jgi:hypothetical protein
MVPFPGPDAVAFGRARHEADAVDRCIAYELHRRRRLTFAEIFPLQA